MLAGSRRRASKQRTAARRGALSVLVALALLSQGSVAQALSDWKPEDPTVWSPGDLPETASVGGADAKLPPAPAPRSDGAKPWVPHASAWPKTTEAQVALAAAPLAPKGPQASPFAANGPAMPHGKVAGLPVWITSADATSAVNGLFEASPAATGQVRVQVADKQTGERAGVTGLMLTVHPADNAAKGRVKVGVDYAAIRGAFGADWGSRVRLVTLPECALTTPELEQCRVQTPLPSVNDADVSQVVADVDLSALATPATAGRTAPTGGAMVLAATAGASGPAGDFGATSLSSTGSWSQTGATGSFTWNYPLGMPAVPGGPIPNVSLGYNSAAVDGRTASTNAQSSWVGDGFDYNPGFVERSNKPCRQDGQTTSSDQCWSNNQVLTASFAGKGGQLVRDDTTGTWKLQGDDATRVERLTGANNGDQGTAGANGDVGEHWKITTPDGTQYFFGVNHRPGGNGTDAATNSAWTVPVYGNNPGEPCYNANFEQASCAQAWRWNLDYVIDASGGLATYTYVAETNYYSRGTARTLTSYVRGGHLESIAFGQKTTDAFTALPPAKVVFTTAERCLPVTGGFTCDPAQRKANPTKWPDTPVDQECAATGTCNSVSPTFFTTHRLTAVTTQSLIGGALKDVDTWELTHSFPDPGDTTSPSMWLDSVTHTGKDGTAIKLPPTTFTGQLMNNRVDHAGDDRPAMNRRRMTTITGESGAQTNITYAPADCAKGHLPASPDTNTKRCIPVYWSLDPIKDPTLDWFHKYVVAQIDEVDARALSPARSTRYEYVGPAYWHRDDSELTEAKYRTWNDFRGYREVITRAGMAPAPITKSSTLYYTGMDGDTKADGTPKPPATVTDSSGGTVPDTDVLAGMAREARVYNGDTAAMTSAAVTDYWTSGVTARRARTGLPDLTAKLVRTGATHSRVLLADGTWRKADTTTTYDAYGMPATVHNRADGVPSTCKTSHYARNTTTWILDRTSEEIDVVGDCGTLPGAATTISHTRAFFDKQALGVLNGPGEITTGQEIERYDGAGQPVFITADESTYDTYGRPLTEKDATGATTTTVYTPATGAAPTTVKTTDVKGFETTTTYQPARGLAVKVVDPNGRTTEATYDALGRTTAVWKPGRAKSASASVTYTYVLSQTATSSVTTKTLRGNQTYFVSHEILDSFLKTRQTQQTPADNSTGRVVSDTFYDSLGRVVKTNNAYYNTAGPSTTLFTANDNEVPGQTGTFYDGMGRTVATTFSHKGNEQWRTTTAYPGADRTDVTPPAGKVPTTTIVDARGKTNELRQYKADTPTGAYDTTRYTYDRRGDLETVVDPAGNTWTYTYDLRGRKVQTDDPDAGTSTTAYDSADRITSTTDARGKTVATKYDELSRVTGTFDGSLAGPQLTGYLYDTVAKGQITSSTRYVGGATGAAYTTRINSYDIGYRPTSTSTVIPAVEGKLQGTYTTTTAYDAITGNPDYTDRPAAGGLPAETVEFGYNANGLLEGSGGDFTYLHTANYDPFGRATRYTMGITPKQAVFTNTWDDATGRLLNTSLAKEGGAYAVDTTAYTYKPSGDVTSITTVQDNGTPDRQCFAYDYQQRLTEAWTDEGSTSTLPSPSVPGIGACVNGAPAPASVGGPNPYWQTFSYDVVGNRTQLVNHDPAGTTANDTTITQTYPAPGTPQPHTVTGVTTTTPAGTQGAAYTYDQAGNTLTRTGPSGSQVLTWNTEGKIDTIKTSEAAAPTSFVYASDGSELIRRDPGKTTLLLGGDEIVLDTAANTVSGTRYYSTGGGPTVVRTSTGQRSYLAADHHGTNTTNIDATTQAVIRRSMKPFGEERTAQPGNWPGQKGFVGGTVDITTGLTTLGARQYDNQLGRFLSIDPIMDLSDPQQINGYSYGNNNPTTLSDPTGLRPNDFDNAGMAPSNPGNIGYVYEGSGSWGVVDYGKPAAIAVVPEGIVTVPSYYPGRVGKPPAPLTPRFTPYPKPKTDNSNWSKFKGAVKKTIKVADSFLGVSETIKNVSKCVFNAGGGSRSSACGQIVIDVAISAATGGAGRIAANVTAKVAEKIGKEAAQELMQTALGCAVPGRNSFPGATPVLLADGTRKAISDIRIGDQVTATDPLTGETSAERVADVIVTHTDKDYTDVTVATSNGVETITSTTHHPYWNHTTQLWTDAGDLKPGDQLRQPNGELLTVLVTRNYNQTITTYNLTVERVHTYYVSGHAVSVLVHNTNGASSEICQYANNLPRGQGIDAASRMTTTDGQEYFAHNMNRSSPGATDYDTDQIINRAGGHHMGCAEIGCIDDAVIAGSPLSGGVMETVHVAPGTQWHLMPFPACASCRPVLTNLNIYPLNG
ncbi:polymorphic toxin-type HINT domain-containing protein [Yinghuangia sp. YIM S09857]|uniref:polymorphic toxin-type HINT domain-containing protein n=1 Tax=Yinghuangia sp. YIM S09857 TaxID=3436929 RepID=UPI003F5366D7